MPSISIRPLTTEACEVEDFKQTKKYSFKTPCGKECYPCWATRREPDFVELGSMQDLREERKADEELDASLNHCRSEKVQGISKNSKKTKIAKKY